jgi:hypothetical protein
LFPVSSDEVGVRFNRVDFGIRECSCSTGVVIMSVSQKDRAQIQVTLAQPRERSADCTRLAILAGVNKTHSPVTKLKKVCRDLDRPKVPRHDSINGSKSGTVLQGLRYIEVESDSQGKQTHENARNSSRNNE